MPQSNVERLIEMSDRPLSTNRSTSLRALAGSTESVPSA